jgi:hypothetical protein
VFLVFEIEPSILPATHALDAEHLFVRSTADLERHEVVARVHHRRLTATAAAESEEAAKATTTAAATALAGGTQQILKLLGAAREGVEHILNILFAALRALAATLRGSAAAADDGTFTRAR